MRAGVVVVGVFLAAACRNEAAPPRVANDVPASACLADRLGELRFEADPLRDGCEVEDEACRQQCDAGDAGACFNRALRLQLDPAHAVEALALFVRGCELGSAIACINHGADLWMNGTGIDSTRCAQRVFARACDAGDELGCTMQGRAMYSLAQGDPERLADVRRYLEAACARAGGFACRVLALHLERGDLGPYAPDLIPALLARACAGGEVVACGEPATAAETFMH